MEATREDREDPQSDTRDELSILVVDDEPIVLESLGDWFREDGFRVDTAANAQEALRLAAGHPYQIAFLDIRMPGVDGLELQERLAAALPDLTIVIMTAYASVESAVRALKAGAYDYVTKPFDPEKLTHLVERARKHHSLRSENRRLKERLEAVGSPAPIIGVSAAIARVSELVAAVAASDATVLVRGESGCGKELVARAIHAGSPRRYGPLVVVNCGALAEGILESELFGHEKGAFTGAQQRRKGKFELADGGTIFLDEVGSVSPKVQADLLRVLEDRRVTRLGAPSPIATDFRVVAATNLDLEAEIAAGRFRDDLYWRLNVFSIEIPPLRQRPEDIPLLAEHFLERFTRAMNRPPMRFSEEAMAALSQHTWRGNVRELQNAVERAVVIGTPPIVEATDLPVRVREGATLQVAGSRSLEALERAHIASVLAETDWNVSQAARVLEIDRGTLYNKIHRFELERPTR